MWTVNIQMFKLVLEKVEEPEIKLPTSTGSSAWKIPWTEEPGRLQSMGSLRVGHDWLTLLSLFTFMYWRRKWQPTPVFLPGEFQGQRAWWAAVYGVAHRVRHDWSDLAAIRSSKKQESSRKNIYFCFMDYAKAFDCVDHNKLWKILKEMGVSDHLTCLLRNLYAGQEATVSIGHETEDWFQIGKGVHQGCILSPCSFNLHAEYIMRNAGLGSTDWNQDC